MRLSTLIYVRLPAFAGTRCRANSTAIFLLQSDRLGQEVTPAKPWAAGCLCFGASSFCEKLFIFFVGPSPEPNDLVWRSPHTHRAVTPADADGNQPIRSMNLLEAQTWATRVRHELAVRGARLTTNVSRQSGQHFRKPRVMCEFTTGPDRAAWSDHGHAPLEPGPPFVPERCPISRTVHPIGARSPSASSNQAPIASCSQSGSFDASKIAFSSSLPICKSF